MHRIRASPSWARSCGSRTGGKSALDADDGTRRLFIKGDTMKTEKKRQMKPGREALNEDGPATRIPLHMSSSQIELLDAEVERLEMPRATLMRAIFDAY